MEGGGRVMGMLNFPVKVAHETKLKELLHKITSIEIKLCSDATKEFIKLLKGEDGGEFLRQYVRASPKCSELLDAWKLRQGKPGILYIFELITNIMSHYEGKYKPNDAESMAISRNLDKFARLLVVEHLGDVYKELNSKEAKRQKAALLMMASVVRRGSSLASEVAKQFDFKLGEFTKLAVHKPKRNEKISKQSLRKSLVGFAMSFLEVGKPGLLRWVLQQREMYSGVLRGFGNDDDETVIYVMSTLRDRILVEESLVPPALRSVLFGSVTLEQLINISGREGGGLAAELAHNVLILVCTDPSNGLMPDLKMRPVPLRGNPKRIMGLMKKLRATEVQYHRDLLLAIVNGRPSFGCLYLEEFPYNIEDFTSPSWFDAVSLAANLVSSVGNSFSMGFINSPSNDIHSFDNMDVQSIMKCLFPHPFSRSVLNKGLLHSDFIVKHGTLRLLLGVIKFLNSVIGALNHYYCAGNHSLHPLVSLKQEILNEVQTLLPDPQVLLALLSSSGACSKSLDLCLKRMAGDHEHGRKNIKKLKVDTSERDIEIVVSGISSAPDITLTENSGTVVNTPGAGALDVGEDLINIMTDIWGPEICSTSITTLKDAEIYLHSKVLDALRYYRCTIPDVLDGSFEFFMGLLLNPLELPTNLQMSLLSLLMEYIEWYPHSEIPKRTPPMLYKHLQPFIKLLIFSSENEIRDQAYKLAKAAMFSTGAFDNNLHEIGAWLLFLPGYLRKKASVNALEVEVLQSLCPLVISFLCDAVSTVGNNLVKHWDILKHYVEGLEGVKDVSPEFSPLTVCVLEKCLRLILSKSGTYSLPEKSMVSLYICNTFKYLLQTQVDAELFSVLFNRILSERLGSHNECSGSSHDWKYLKNLLLFAQNISCQQGYCNSSSNEKSVPPDISLSASLNEVKILMSSRDGDEMTGIIMAFISAVVCVETDEILMNLPSLMAISHDLREIPFPFLSSIVFLDHNVLPRASELWSGMFYAGLHMSVSDLSSSSQDVASVGTSDFPLKEDYATSDQHVYATEAAAAAAFSLFLKQAPFYVIFPAIMCMNSHNSSELLKIQELLLDKLSECKTDHVLLSNLRLVLFWVHHIQSYYKLNAVVEVQQISILCVTLVRKLLAQLLSLQNGSDCCSNTEFCPSSGTILEVVKSIFNHPSVLMSVSFPFSNSQNFPHANLLNRLDVLILSSSQGINKLSDPVLNILMTTLDYLWSVCTTHPCPSNARDDAWIEVVKAFKGLQQRLFKEVTDRFELCVCTKDSMPVLPAVCTLHALVRFISPFQLLELVDWIFSRVEVNDFKAMKSALSIGCSLAAGAFHTLSCYLQQPIRSRVPYDLFWEVDDKNINANICEQIYSRVVYLAVTFKLDYADKCLLEAADVLYKQKHEQQQNIHPVVLAMWRIIMITPVNIISHCIYETNTDKAKFLYILTEISPLHASIFGHSILGILNRNFPEDHFMLLLPASLSYLNLISMRFGKQNHRELKTLPDLYSRILLECFHQWSNFVSKGFFEEDHGEFLPSSLQQLLCLIDNSLLGKSIRMLQYHFALNGYSMELKKRLKLFKSICSSCVSHDELLNCDSQLIDCYSVNQSLNGIIRVVTKILLCKMLLFHGEADKDLKEVSSKMVRKLEASRIRFINILVDIWQCIIKKFSLASYQPETGKSANISSLYNHLEVFMLRSILELIADMRDDLIHLQSFPFLEQLFRSALLHRFGDPATLKILQVMLSLLCEGRISCDLYLQLLLAHSQFAPTLHAVPKSSGFSPVGSFLKPISSILKCLTIPSDHHVSDEMHVVHSTELTGGRLEIVKLLRILFEIKSHKTDSDSTSGGSINFKELHSLLRLSYGATSSEIDLEIYRLMQQIECIGGLGSQNVTDLDCLWGIAALRIKKEQPLDKYTYSDIHVDMEAIEEWSRSQHRENIPIDPEICASTVLFFPYDRSTREELLSMHKIQSDNVGKLDKIRYSPDNVREQYDPVFILHFSIYSLSKSYIEPVEFAGSGLLAVAFVSMSSPDLGLRRLAYDTLDKFKKALENCQKRKDVMQLRLLLTCVQNSIEEPWQRIPSVIALFVAEASCVLLDSSHYHYAAISTLLINSSKLNMKVIPLFDQFFWSTSTEFQMERFWMLQLVYAGLNSDDDAMIYIRNSVLENLMSFYVSPLSDRESKGLIIEVIKKSVKLHRIAFHLVKHCSLFSWLSSLISVPPEKLNVDGKSFFFKQFLVVLTVVSDVISSGNMCKWLQEHALEQLMELSHNLFMFILRDVMWSNETAVLVNPSLQIIASLLKLSQKRKIYQPHFTLSYEGLYQIYQVVDLCNHGTVCVNSVFALEAILMHAPPVSIFLMNEEKLERFLMWLISTALQSDSPQKLMAEDSHAFSTKELREECEAHEDSLASKLLRWLAASVIIGNLYQKTNDMDPEFLQAHSSKCLQSLLEHVDNISQTNDKKIGAEKLVASTIFYLQLFLGHDCSVLPSVVSALCLLIFGAPGSVAQGHDLMEGYDASVSSLCRRVRCPPEANPSWRWSFYQPWKDLSVQLTELQRTEEYHSCLTLLVIISNVLCQKKLESSSSLSPIDIESSGVFEWERSLLQTGC